jgi:hypothetical protein
MDIKEEEYIKAFTPFYNGCSHKLIFKNNGDVLVDIGCYNLDQLATGVKAHLNELYDDNNCKPFKIDVTPECKVKLIQIKPCEHCGGTLFERMEK